MKDALYPRRGDDGSSNVVPHRSSFLLEVFDERKGGGLNLMQELKVAILKVLTPYPDPVFEIQLKELGFQSIVAVGVIYHGLADGGVGPHCLLPQLPSGKKILSYDIDLLEATHSTVDTL